MPAGARIPGIPRQSFKLRMDGEVGSGARVGATFLFAGGSRARGDENNLDAHGSIPALRRRQPRQRGRRSARASSCSARVNNVFDRRYANFGILGRNAFADPARTFDPASGQSETFLGLGAPRGAWVGLRYEWD